MEEIKIFQNSDFGTIRTMEINDEPWFVGKDIAESLGYAKPENAVAVHVDDEDKTSTLIQGTGSNYKSKAVIINESGLYSLVLSSKLPTAKQFKRWVTSEVLPAIRKHGAYMTPQTLGEALKNPDTLIEILQRLKAEQEKSALLETTVRAQSQTIAEMKPKASYYDVVLNCKDLLSVTQIAKDYGKSAVWLNDFLHKKHVQFKQGKCWFLYQRYAEQGYTSTKTQTFNAPNGTVHTKVHMYWTQKGRLFLYDLLKSEGVLPLMEQ